MSRKTGSHTVGAKTSLSRVTLAGLQVPARVSPLAVWLEQRFDQLAALGRIGNWQAVCDLVAADGLTDAKGQPITSAVVSRVWSRLKIRRQRDRETAGPGPRSDQDRGE